MNMCEVSCEVHIHTDMEYTEGEALTLRYLRSGRLRGESDRVIYDLFKQNGER